MSIPAVSVIIPTYDRIHYLREAVSSVLRQSMADLELIVVDDGSSDETSAYFDVVTDPRVQFIQLPHTGNIARVRNVGAGKASGHYLCFLDSDDLWLSNKLEVQVSQMSSAGVEWSYTNFELMDERGVSIPMKAGSWQSLSGRIAGPLITTEAAVALCTVMVRRDCFSRLTGFDEDPRLILREDYEFLVRLANSAATVAIDEVLGRIRHHPARSTAGPGTAAPFVTTAYACTKLLKELDDADLRRAARRRRGYHFARAAVRSAKDGALAPAIAYGARALLDRLR